MFAALLVPYAVWFFDLDWSVRLGVGLFFAVNGTVAFVETVASLLLALRARIKRTPMAVRRHSYSVIVRAFGGALPVLVIQTARLTLVADRCYLQRHMQELEAVVNGADPEQFGFMDAYRDPQWTVIQAVNFSIGDCYWIIHSEVMVPSEENGPAFLTGRLWKVVHIWGPWYSLLS